MCRLDNRVDGPYFGAFRHMGHKASVLHPAQHSLRPTIVHGIPLWSLDQLYDYGLVGKSLVV